MAIRREQGSTNRTRWSNNTLQEDYPSFVFAVSYIAANVGCRDGNDRDDKVQVVLQTAFKEPRLFSGLRNRGLDFDTQGDVISHVTQNGELPFIFTIGNRLVAK